MRSRQRPRRRGAPRKRPARRGRCAIRAAVEQAVAPVAGPRLSPAPRSVQDQPGRSDRIFRTLSIAPIYSLWHHYSPDSIGVRLQSSFRGYLAINRLLKRLPRFLPKNAVVYSLTVMYNRNEIQDV